MNKATIEEIEKYEKELRELIEQANYKIYQIVTHVSRSGMYRHIKNLIVIDNEIRCIDWYISKIIKHVKLHDDGIGISGCGMDMGFALTYELSQKLFGDGYKIQQKWL